ncbi:hypothetical protein [Caballeronia sp. HLA56]
MKTNSAFGFHCGYRSRDQWVARKVGNRCVDGRIDCRDGRVDAVGISSVKDDGEDKSVERQECSRHLTEVIVIALLRFLATSLSKPSIP